MRNELPGGYRISQIRRDRYFTMTDTHYHPYYEIYYLLSGTRKIFIEDSIYKLKKGDLILIRKGAIHRTTYLSDESHERIVLKVSEEMVNEVFELAGGEWKNRLFEYPHFTLPETRQEYLHGLLQKLEHEWDNQDELSPLTARGYIHELLIYLLRYQKRRDVTQISQLDTTDESIQKAARYIRRHFNQPISLEKAAALVNMSPTYFSKKFKRATGFGFKEYLLKLRLQEAALRLISTDESVTEIALRCGFNDSNYFGAVFKKEFGTPPLQYRKHTEEGS